MKPGLWTAIGLGALTLCGCDNGPSAVARTDTASQAVSQAPPVAPSTPAPVTAAAMASAASSAAALPATIQGKPLWSSTRTYTAEANAARAFAQNGAAVGAKDTADYVRMAHAFIDHPPKGTLTYKRPNGDLMLYDPKTNTFSVATQERAPRTLFKPREGAAYWQEQMAKEKGKG
ncbi:MAG: hypothetical protein JWM33_1487 [Caulobacteraceae bacterium]|nr:hypothetical protein [Caulobacteraceae bacterium]